MPAAFLREANGVCRRIVDATRRWVNDAVRPCGSDACRLTAGPSVVLVATVVCEQAASQAPARMTAVGRAAFRPVRNATHKTLTHLMYNMLHPQLVPLAQAEIQHVKGAIQSGRIRGRPAPGAVSPARFQLGVIIAPQRVARMRARWLHSGLRASVWCERNRRAWPSGSRTRPSCRGVSGRGRSTASRPRLPTSGRPPGARPSCRRCA